MLTRLQVQAIAKLTTDSKSVGTGFLIDARGLLLTAFHVLTKGSDPALLAGTTVTVTFPDYDQELRARYVKGSPDDDWALIQLVTLPDDGSGPIDQRAPAEVKPLPLAALQGHQAHNATWSVFGYPAQAPDGFPRSGLFALWDDTAVEVEANVIGMAMEGISGAPILVDGEVVGITLAADLNAGLSVAGRFQIVPLSVVFADQQLPLIAAPEAPMFTLQVALKLPKQADEYDIARDLLPTVADPLGPRRVAAALLHRGVQGTHNVCKRLQLDAAAALPVLSYVASSAVAPQAAAILRQFCQARAASATSTTEASPQAAAMLRADPASACWYVLRATGGDFPRAQPFTPADVEGRTFSVVIDESWSPAEVITHIEQEGAEALKKRAERCLAARDNWVESGWFILRLDAPATPAVHAAIVDRFPGAHVFVHANASATVPPALVGLFADVKPEIEDESALLKHYEAAVLDF